MRDLGRPAAPTRSSRPEPDARAVGGRAPQSGSLPARALALQRLVGNRATGRALARWRAHPDKDKKGALLPDVAAEELLRFNPPKNQ